MAASWRVPAMSAWSRNIRAAMRRRRRATAEVSGIDARRFRCGAMTLILALCAVPAIGQTPPGAESPTSWTFDTYTPGPCSPTGAAHGGCNPGERLRIAVTTIASGLVQPLAPDLSAGHQRPPCHRAAGASSHHPQRCARSGTGSRMAHPLDSFAHSPFIRPASALRRQPHRVPDLREGKGRGDAYADDHCGRTCPLRRQGAVSGRTDLRGRRMGRRLVAGTRGVRARRHAVPLGGRSRQPQ